jgi:hypothetical protein
MSLDDELKEAAERANERAKLKEKITRDITDALAVADSTTSDPILKTVVVTLAYQDLSRPAAPSMGGIMIEMPRLSKIRNISVPCSDPTCEVCNHKGYPCIIDNNKTCQEGICTGCMIAKAAIEQRMKDAGQ